MVMRKTTDAALIQIPEKDLKPCQDAIREIKSAKWSLAYSKSRGTLLMRRRASVKRNEGAAEDLESSLAKVAPELPKKLIWAWSSGGEERYFPNSELLILFDEGTSESERKEMLGKIKGIKVQTYPNVGVKPPVKRVDRPPPKGYDVPGFSGSEAKQALKALQESQRERPGKRETEQPSELCVPVARISIPDARRSEIFEIASQITALPRVLAVTPDFSVLGKKVRGEPQQWAIPPTTAYSIHELNMIHLAWALVDPADLSAPAGQFLASREQVAVLDWDFPDHPDITYDLKGYDAADHDRDPRTPESGEDPHGMWMSGVIGGVGHGVQIRIGIAPGTVIIPVRPSWSTEDDFYEVDGEQFFSDYEEFVDRWGANWVEAIIRLWHLSHSGLEVANMSIALKSYLWNDSGVPGWMDWWLRTGNYGYGVFAAASAGNNPDGTTIAIPARSPYVFAVGWGDLANSTMLGNSGQGLEIVGNTGWWPMYKENGQITVNLGGGSSVASAMVAATVAMMKSLNHLLTIDEIKTILRLTTRKASGQGAAEDANGYSTNFGWGFLNAYHAIDIVWRDRNPAAELFRINYRAGQPPRAMIQLRQWPWSSYAGKRTGMFWALSSQSGVAEQRWIHDRDPELRHIDQAIDIWGLPFGEFILVGDFDGDGLDEIALQLDASEFWPQFADDPAHSFFVYKYDEASDGWQALGARSPYASGLASPQVVFPTAHPVRGVLAADLKGDGKQCLFSWQDNVVNALQYNAATNTFVLLNPENFAPPALSAAIDQAPGYGDIIEQRILNATRIGPIAGRDAVLCVSTVVKQWRRVVHSRWGTHVVSSSMPHRFLTVFVLGYDPAASQWRTIPLSSDPNDTHILLWDELQSPVVEFPLRRYFSSVETVLTGNFSSTVNPADVKAVIHMANDQFYYISLHLDAVNAAFSGYTVYNNNLTLEGRVSRVRAGSFGIGGPVTQLAWLSDATHGNQVHFLMWNDAMRGWEDPGIVVSHDRKDNEAIDLAVAEGFYFAGLAGINDVIALLMTAPDANTFKTYRWDSGAGRFDPMGVL